MPFPSLGERFERLEETLQIAQRMFDGDTTPYEGRHFQLAEPVNNPMPVRRPPIMVGGMGERRTLRLVAQYADACNLFEMLGPDGLARKLDVLTAHCADVGRPYDEIVKTTLGMLGDLDLGWAKERFAALAELGVDLAIVDLPDPADERVFDFLGALVREMEPLGRAMPVPVAARR